MSHDYEGCNVEACERCRGYIIQGYVNLARDNGMHVDYVLLMIDAFILADTA